MRLFILCALIAVSVAQEPVGINLGVAPPTLYNATSSGNTTQQQTNPVTGVTGGEQPLANPVPQTIPQSGAGNILPQEGAVPQATDQLPGTYVPPFGQPNPNGLAAGVPFPTASTAAPTAPVEGAYPAGIPGIQPVAQENTPSPGYENPFIPEQVITTTQGTNQTSTALYGNTEDINGTVANVTSVTESPPGSSTTGAYNPWQALKNWFLGNNKDEDDGDYYDDNYYDDDYYDDYMNGTGDNYTDSYYSDWYDVTQGTTSAPLPAGVSDAVTVPYGFGASTEGTFSTTESPCPLNAVTLRSACVNTDTPPSADDLDLTLGDISRLIFDEAVINDLILACSPGQWCLKDSRFFTPLKSRSFEYFCNYTECLYDAAGQCNTEERTIVTSSLSALCSMSRMNTSDTCSTRVKMLLHVAYADMRRSQMRAATEDVCGMQIESSTCGEGKESCYSVAESFSCLSDECMTEELRSVWANIPFWQWYFWDPDYMRGVCKITNSTDCQFILPTPQTEQYVFFVNYDKLDTRMMTTMAAALVVALAGFIVAVWACVKKFSGGYTRDKVQYAEIRDNNFDSV